MGTSAKNTHNPLAIYEPFILNVFQMHPAECASEIKGTVALRSAGGFGRLSVQARNGFRRLSEEGYGFLYNIQKVYITESSEKYLNRAIKMTLFSPC